MHPGDEPTDRPPDPLVVRFQKPAPPPPTRVALIWLVSVGLGLFVGQRLGLDAGFEDIGTLIGGLVGLAVAFQLYRRARGPADQPPEIVFSKNRVSLPRTAFQLEAEWVPIRDVVSVELLGSAHRGYLLVHTRRRTYTYPLAMIGGLRVAQALRAEVLRRIALEPDAEALLEGMKQRELAAERIARHEPRGTRGILYVIAGVYVLASVVGAYDASGILETEVILVRLGASVPELVREGEWFRLFTGNLLHGHIIHIGFNALAILVLGSIVERLMGTPRFLILYLVTGVTGTLASVWLSGAMLSVGASTSVFGLFLAWGYLTLRHRGRLPPGFAMSRAQWLVLAFNFALPLLPLPIDGWGHAGGAIGGVLVAAVMFPTVAAFERPWGGTKPWWGLAAVLIAVYGAAVAFAVRRDVTDPFERIDLLRLAVADEGASANELNNLAWYIAIDKTATEEELELAHRAAARAVEGAESDGPRSAYLDTRATAAYRLGRHAEAITSELEAIHLDPQSAARSDAVYWSQLHRFLDAHLAAKGQPFGIEEVGTATVAAREGGIGVRTTAGGTFYFGVAKGKRRVGLLEVRVPEPTKGELVKVLRGLPPEPTFTLLGATAKVGETEAVVHGHNRDIDDYP